MRDRFRLYVSSLKPLDDEAMALTDAGEIAEMELFVIESLLVDGRCPGFVRFKARMIEKGLLTREGELHRTIWKVTSKGARTYAKSRETA